jgi:PhzF family phenazine biosynthesis protein
MRIRVVDAFTDRPFAGNPAGVCLLEGEDWPDETWMQQVAAELNLSETAFARPLTANPDADWALRWFTPAVEVRLCGHATLATTHAMRADGLVDGKVRFKTLSGVLTAEVAGDGMITLDFPAAELTEIAVPDGLAEALGATPIAAYGTGALRDLLVVMADEKAVRGLDPDLRAISQLVGREDDRGVIVTAAAEQHADYDFVSRFFAPAVGIDEDPVTGSAHTALAPYWVSKLGGYELVGYQASRRGGLVRTELAGDRVKLTGRAVVVLDATLFSGP